MLLTERPHVVCQEIVWLMTSTGHRVPATRVDMRFEVARADGRIRDEPEAWAAPLGDNQFLLHTGSVVGSEQVPHNIPILPRWWMDYVLGVYGNTYTKAAKDHASRNEPSQEELDKKLDLSDLLDAALTPEPALPR